MNDLLKHFKVQELVPSDVYRLLGDHAINLINKKMLITIQSIREYFNRPVIINVWNSGGRFQYRGFRPVHCSIGVKNSMHRYGMAIDFDVKGLHADEVRSEIIRLGASRFPHITRMERGVSWVHIDMKPTGKAGIYMFNP